MIGGDYKKERFSERLTMAQSQPKNRGYLPGTQQRGKFGYSSATLLGNWIEEKYDATYYNPNEAVLRHASNRNKNWQTTYEETIGKAAKSLIASSSSRQEQQQKQKTSLEVIPSSVIPQQVMLALEDRTKCSYPGDQSLFYNTQIKRKDSSSCHYLCNNTISPIVSYNSFHREDVPNSESRSSAMKTVAQLSFQDPKNVKVQPALTLQPTLGHSSTAQANAILQRLRHELKTICKVALSSSFPGNVMGQLRSLLYATCTKRTTCEINVHELYEAFVRLNALMAKHCDSITVKQFTCIQLQEAECFALIRAYDHHANETAHVEVLVDAIRGPLSDRRMPVIERVYMLLEEIDNTDSIDNQGDDDNNIVRLSKVIDLIDLEQLCISEIEHINNVKRDNTSESKNKDAIDQIQKDYVNQWMCLLLNTCKNDLDKIKLKDALMQTYVDKATFVNFFTDVSFEIISDTQFERLMRNLWHLTGGNGNCANTSCTSLEVLHTNGRITHQRLRNDLPYYKEIRKHAIESMAMPEKINNYILDNLYEQNVKDIKSYRIF